MGILFNPSLIQSDSLYKMIFFHEKDTATINFRKHATDNFLSEKKEVKDILYCTFHLGKQFDHLSFFCSTSVQAYNGSTKFQPFTLLSTNLRTEDQLKCQCCNVISCTCT